VLDAQSDVFLTKHQINTGLDYRHRHQLTWMFRTLIFATEACAIFGTGLLLDKATGGEFGFLQPLELSFAYCFLIVLMDGVAVPPFKRKSGTAIRAVTGVFVCSFGLHASLALTTAWGTAALGAWFVGSVAGVTILRNGAMDLAQRFPATWPPPLRALVLGGGSWASEFTRANRLAGARAAFDVIGAVTDPTERLHDGIDMLARQIVEEKVTDVFLALPLSAAERIDEILAALQFLPITVRLAPERLPSNKALALKVGAVASMLVLVRPPSSNFDLSVKRALDVVGALTLLVLLAPLFAVLAVLIKCDSSGPVLFCQTRIGQFGRSFLIYKFRSLHIAHSDANAERLVSRGDLRVTRVGRYARKYSLDELPQLLNVVFGSMSLVGPRPHASCAKADGRLYAEVQADYPLRYRVKPGMTGWAQVNGWRGNTDTAEKLLKRVEFDFEYIRRWSLAMDAQILLRTIPSVLAPPADNA